MTTQPNRQKPADDFMRIQDLFYLCANRWYWFVISLFITISIAVLYIKRTPATYDRTATILIKEDSKGSSATGDISGLEDLGLIQTNTNINNEIVTIQATSLMADVVKRLNLNVDYTIEGRFHDIVLYGTNRPIEVKFDSIAAAKNLHFAINILNDNKVELSDFIINGTKQDKTIKANGILTKPIATPFGTLTVVPTAYYNGAMESPILVSTSDILSTAKNYKSRLNVSLGEEKTTIINLSFSDVSTQRAEDVLNTLIEVYNENWVKDKNRIAVSTSEFINDRLAVIEQELGNVDEDISSFKSKNLVPDVAAVSSMYMAQSHDASNELQMLNNHLYMAKFIRNYITEKKNKDQLIPANSGIESGAIETQIGAYNNALIERNKLVANSSEQNPLVENMDNNLAALRAAIVTSIDNYIVTLNAQIKSTEKSELQANTKIAENPTQAKYLLSVERQQKVKESLYLFLLQKREENELSQAFSAYNTRIIQAATGSMIPSAPLKKNILLVAFAIGLLVPAIIIFLRETMNTKLRGRKDLEQLSMPFLGEIPLAHKKNSKNIFSKKDKQTELKIVVKPGNRNISNEAFRVLRTNLEFMMGQKKDENVIVVTSFNPGSGKSFSAMNIAASLSLKNKKVLVIDGDLRHGSTSSYINSPKQGLTDYLNGAVNDVSKIIVPLPKYSGVNVIPIGTIPPNPTELLEENRLKNLLESVRHNYDYVFVDCPPIDIVADTQIIEQYADRTIFVVRAGLLERSMIQELENIYTEKRFKNLALVLNGTISSNSRYGYKYGYKYGYQYGYGYGYASDEE